MRYPILSYAQEYGNSLLQYRRLVFENIGLIYPLPSLVRSWQQIKRRILKGLLVVLLLALLADTLGYVAWQHWQYGDYPTSHISANFRHGGTSDLVAFTSGQDVEIMEFVGKQLSRELDLGQHTLLLMSDGSTEVIAHEEQASCWTSNRVSLTSEETYRLFLSLQEQFR